MMVDSSNNQNEEKSLPPSSSSSSSSITSTAGAVRFATEMKDTEKDDHVTTIDISEFKALQGIPIKPTMTNFATNRLNRTLKRLADDSVEMSFLDEYEASLAKRECIIRNQMASLQNILSMEDEGQRRELFSEDGIVQAITDYIQNLESATKNMNRRIHHLHAMSDVNQNEVLLENPMIENATSQNECAGSIDGQTTVASSSTMSSSSSTSLLWSADCEYQKGACRNLGRPAAAAIRLINVPSERSLALALITLDALLIYCNELFCYCAAWKYPASSGISILPLVFPEDRPLLLSRLNSLKAKQSLNSSVIAGGSDLASDSCSDSSGDQSMSTGSGSSRLSRQDLSEIVVRAYLPDDNTYSSSTDRYLLALMHKRKFCKFQIAAHFTEDSDDIPDRLAVTWLFLWTMLLYRPDLPTKQSFILFRDRCRVLHICSVQFSSTTMCFSCYLLAFALLHKPDLE
eukprot:scaffold387_cov174-Ochromonas_danica.AAC.4